MNGIEILGLLSSVLVALSMTMKSLKTLRFLNTLGAIGFVVYGVFLGAWSVVLLNALIIGVNSYYFFKPNVYQRLKFKISENDEYWRDALAQNRELSQNYNDLGDQEKSKADSLVVLMENQKPVLWRLTDSDDATLFLHILPSHRRSPSFQDHLKTLSSQ